MYIILKLQITNSVDSVVEVIVCNISVVFLRHHVDAVSDICSTSVVLIAIVGLF